MYRKLVTACITASIFIAPATQVLAVHSGDPEPKVSSVSSINLSSDLDKLFWEVDGDLTKGVKVVFSKNENPEYPGRSGMGDKYVYLNDNAADELMLNKMVGDGEYYVRVCEYLGGECGTYSNEIMVTLTKPDVQSVKEKVKEKIAEKVKEKCDGFSDTDEDNTFCKHIKLAKRNQVVSGFSDGSFKPDQKVTRGEFSAIVVRAFKVPLSETGDNFTDVDEDNTFYDQILTLKNLGVVSGKDGEFFPDGHVTRGAAVKIVLNTIEAMELYDFPLVNNDLDDEFADDGLENHTFAKFIKRMWFATKKLANPIFKGYSDGKFWPDRDLTRGQAVKIIINSMRLVNYLTQADFDAVENEASSDSNTDVSSITLSLDGNSASWTVEGESEKGYKVVYSMNENPTYPTRDGDHYIYIDDPETMEVDIEPEEEGDYYVRVCEYLGGACGTYSNELEFSYTE